MKKRMLLLLAICCSLLLPACASNDATVNAIRARGELRAGVKVDVKHFGYLNPETNALEGLEIDIARELAAMIVGDSAAIRFVPVTAPTRETMLTNGEVDIVIATFTITDARKEVLNFTHPYFVDEIGFLVMKDTGIDSLADFTGKTIGASRSSTAFTTLTDKPEILGTAFTLKGYASYPELQNALSTGDIDVFCSDKSILYGYWDDRTVLLDEGILPQPYGIATVLTDKAFAAEIDRLLGELEASGKLAEIINKWTQ